MIDQAPITNTFPLDIARDAKPVGLTGHYLRIVGGDDGAVIKVAFDSERSREVELVRGRGWCHMPFRKLYISNDAQEGKAVTILVAGSPGDAKPEMFDAFCEESTAQTIMDLGDRLIG